MHNRDELFVDAAKVRSRISWSLELSGISSVLEEIIVQKQRESLQEATCEQGCLAQS